MSPPAASRDERSAPWFDAAADGVLLARRCRSGHWSAPMLFFGGAVLACATCGDVDLEWAPTAGRGSLVTWTEVPGPDGGTMAAAVVELDEGPWVFGSLAVPADERVEGLRLVVGFERPGGGEPVPVFARPGAP
ncbi:MAG TPA: OB-fold domain-containing protein [Acidimicrobiales bacterium]|nr:OB-fold domain-containing protein [Acidimicrobiales bacterium]